MKDVFEDGYVDVAIFQPTYLKEWYAEGFNTTETATARSREKHPGKFIVNTRWDPRDGDAGLKELETTSPAGDRRASSSTPPSGATARVAGR